MGSPRTERLVRHWKQLPPERGGVALLVLWVNAVVTVLLQGCLVVALGRTGIRLCRHRGNGLWGSAGHHPAPVLPVLAGAVVAHQVVRWSGMRILDRCITRSEKPMV